MRSLPLWLILGCISLSTVAAPTFTDRGTEAGYLNPADTEIVVQTVRAVGDGTYNTSLNAVQIRNYNGTANYQQITRIEVRNGGATICFIDTPVGLTTVNGVPMVSTHTITKGDTEDLFVLVWVGDANSVQGGETLHLDVRFHYLLNGTAGSSSWVSDGKPEELRKAGFDRITDSSPGANNFNPADEDTIQLTTFQDLDANDSVQSVSKITVNNTGTATADDIASLKVHVQHPGGTWEETKTTNLGAWKDGGLVFDPPDIIVPDAGEVVVTVVAKIAGPTATVPTDNRTIRTRIDLEVVENGQTLHQTALASTTQKIRRGGVEDIEDDSTIPASGVLNSGEALTQKIVVGDKDVNGLRVNITRIWVKNLGTAAATEIAEIRVKSNGVPLGTFTGGQIAAILAGVWLDITDVLVADQGDRTFIIEYEIASGNTLRPQVKVEGDEDGNLYTSSPVDYPEPVTLYPAGFEIVENQNVDSQKVYSEQRFCAQKIRLKDIDENSNSVTINPVVPRNRGTATDAEIAKVEVRNEAGDLLGETTTVGGLSAGGVAISTLRNNVVADNGEVALWIWVTLAGPEHTVTDHTVELETTVFHAESGRGYEKTVRGTSFPTELNHRPVVNFEFEQAQTPSTSAISGLSIRPMQFTYQDTIQFTAIVTDEDGAVDEPFTYLWDFGDGNTSTDQNPTHQYPNGGTFQVTLTVTDARGVSGTATKTITVEGPPAAPPADNDPPVAAFTVNKTTSSVGEALQFTDQSTDADGTVTDWAWNFGDGGISTAENPTHAFMAAGVFTVSLIVTDNDLADSVQSASTTITVNAPTDVVVYSYPNPASTQATIFYNLPAGTTSPVLRIFDLVGRLVRRVELPVAQTTYVWNLTADVGGAVANGLYFCVVTAQNAAGAAIRSQIFKLLIDR